MVKICQRVATVNQYFIAYWSFARTANNHRYIWLPPAIFLSKKKYIISIAFFRNYRHDFTTLLFSSSM